MDKTLIKSRFSSNFATYNDNAIAQKTVIAHLLSLIEDKKYAKVLEIGCGTGLLTKELAKLEINHLFINDICESVKNIINIETPHSFVIGDAEEITLEPDLDLIVSANAFQWLENTEKFFEKTAKSLAQNGKMIFSTFVAGNYKEISSTFQTSLNYKTKEQLETEAGRYFSSVKSQEDEITIYFETIKELLTHIKRTGANAVGNTRLTKSKLLTAKNEYEKLRTPKGLPLTYKPAYFVLEK